MGNHSCYVVKFLCCLLPILVAISCPCQTYYTNIKTFGEADGFNITEGGNLYQDNKGFIWIASRNGLYRFNGTSFKHYKHSATDGFSLPGNQVNFCFQDKDGDYWVGVFGKGLYRFDDKTERFTAWQNGNKNEIDLSQQYNVAAPFQDSHGGLWVSATTVGIVRINKKQGTAKLFNVCDQYDPGDLYRSCRWVHHFSEDKDGWFWLCSNDGIIHFNPSNGNFKVFRNSVREVTCFFQDSEGEKWVGTWGAGLKKMDTTTPLWGEYKWSPGSAGTTNIVSGITEKDHDHLWVSSVDGGLMLFNKRTGGFVRVESQVQPAKLLRNTYALFKDRQQNVWIEGNEELGRINNKLFQYGNIANNSLKTPKLTSCFLHIPGDSLVFVGTIYSSEGLHAYNLNTGTTSVIKLHLPGQTEDITGIFQDSQGQTWISTTYGPYLLDRRTLKVKAFTPPSKEYRHLIRKSIVRITEDKLHRLWFASRWNGLFCFDPRTKQTIQYCSDSSGKHHIPVDHIEYLSFDADNNLWAGTHPYLKGQPSVFCLRSDGTLVDFDGHIPLNTVYQVESPAGNTIIAATASEGLFEIESALKKGQTIHHFSEDEGIANSYIEGFAKDKEGNLWITTHNGLSCRTVKGQFINFHTEDGMAGNKIEGRPYIDKEDNIFLPFENGFQYFNTDSLLEHHASVGPVILESLTINQKQYPANPSYLNSLDLTYNENNISLGFAAFDLSQGDRLQYAYKLEGSDTSWTSIGSSRQLFFSNLSPGNYKLRLRAGDRFNNWSHKELVLPITIDPPFWKTWWFYLLCLLLLLAVGYSIYKLRINRILAEQKLRNKIARDLHDDIGSTLSGIKLFSNMAQTRLIEENSGAVNIVERIGERSEKMIDAMSDIVWSINPVNDSIDNMLVRMKQYAAEMMEPRNINYQFLTDERLSKNKIGLESRKDVYLVFKESINNAVKYSNCQNIKIEMKAQNKLLVLTIADDGIGFDPGQLNGHGNGLRNFRERAEIIGGTVTISSQPGQGTKIQLTVPVT